MLGCLRFILPGLVALVLLLTAPLLLTTEQGGGYEYDCRNQFPSPGIMAVHPLPQPKKQRE